MMGDKRLLLFAAVPPPLSFNRHVYLLAHKGTV